MTRGPIADKPEKEARQHRGEIGGELTLTICTPSNGAYQDSMRAWPRPRGAEAHAQNSTVLYLVPAGWPDATWWGLQSTVAAKVANDPYKKPEEEMLWVIAQKKTVESKKHHLGGEKNPGATRKGVTKRHTDKPTTVQNDQPQPTNDNRQPHNRQRLNRTNHNDNRQPTTVVTAWRCSASDGAEASW